MPRPKLDPDSTNVRELRITPPDGLPITDWKATFIDFKYFIAAQEGGEGTDKRLHYHLYIETFRSESWITKWIYSIAHCYNGESGNSVFFSRKPHEHTHGYVVKHGNIAHTIGYTEAEIATFIEQSASYVRDKSAARKRTQRLAKSFTQQVYDEIVSEIDTETIATPPLIVSKILTKYKSNGKMLPSRNVVDTLIISVLNAKGCDVSAFYLRSFSEW